MAKRWVERTAYFDQLFRWKDKQIIKVVTGVRRYGKSTMMRMYQDRLRKEDVGSEQIISINLEDFDYFDLLDARKLHQYIKEHLRPEKMNYIFIDEVQQCEQFPRVVDSLFLREDVDIYLTGSNIKMLSGEIAPILSGRYVEIKMYPLSFREYVDLICRKRTESILTKGEVHEKEKKRLGKGADVRDAGRAGRLFRSQRG